MVEASYSTFYTSYSYSSSYASSSYTSSYTYSYSYTSYAYTSSYTGLPDTTAGGGLLTGPVTPSQAASTHGPARRTPSASSRCRRKPTFPRYGRRLCPPAAGEGRHRLLLGRSCINLFPGVDQMDDTEKAGLCCSGQVQAVCQGGVG